MKKSLLAKKKVFIGPIDVGTNASLKKVLEKSGYQVTTCSIFTNDFRFVDDLNFGLKATDSRWQKILKAIPLVFKLLIGFNKFQIYHFRYGVSLLPFNLDLVFLRLAGKKIIVQFDGSGLRQLDRFKKDKINRLLIKEAGDDSFFRAWLKRFKYFWIKIWADKIVVVTPDLLEFAPEAELVLNFVVDDNPMRHPNKNRRTINILHAPTDRKIKGTRFIISAVKKLQKEFPVKLLLLENLPHNQALSAYQEANIVVDQLLIGAYGVVAIEAMKFAKPVVCYIRKDLRRIYPQDLPIISADPASCYEKLKELVSDRKLRLKIGRQSRKYFLKYHSEGQAQKIWQRIYRGLN